MIALSETWFKEDDSNLLDIHDYHLISVPRRNRRSGGSALYVHKSITFCLRSDLNLIQGNNDNVMDHSESVFVELTSQNGKNTIIGNIYRAHRTNVNLFNQDLTACLDRIASENKNCYISGDFNLDLLMYNHDNAVTDFVNNFYAHNMFPIIDRVN